MKISSKLSEYGSGGEGIDTSKDTLRIISGCLLHFEGLDTNSGALKRVVALRARFRPECIVADDANGNSKKITRDMEARICTAVLANGKLRSRRHEAQ